MPRAAARASLRPDASVDHRSPPPPRRRLSPGESDYVFEDADGRVERARAAHHVHTAGELVRLLRGAGFGAVSLLGADGAGPYRLGSPRLVAVAVASFG